MQITDLCSTLHLEFIKIREEVLNLGHKWESPDCGREGVLRLRFCFFLVECLEFLKTVFLFSSVCMPQRCPEINVRRLNQDATLTTKTPL